MEYLWALLLVILIILLVIILDIWSLVHVPMLAQIKGYNVYAWIGLAWVLGIISYFILKGLAYNNKLSTENEKVSQNNLDKVALGTADVRPKATINKVLTQNNKNIISKTTNTNNQQKVSYSAWVCPKCGEKTTMRLKIV